MRLNDWPVGERPREKLNRHGAEHLSEADLLAILMGSGATHLNAVELARRLLVHFGGLRALLAASATELGGQVGLGPARIARLQVLPELANRWLAERLPHGEALRDPASASQFLMLRLRDRPYESFCCLFLDNRHRVIQFSELFRGTIDGAAVYPREVVKDALANNAAAVILAHNHPSGIAEPSQADERITKRLKAALALVDIRLLDHLIIGDGETTSLCARGLV